MCLAGDVQCRVDTLQPNLHSLQPAPDTMDTSNIIILLSLVPSMPQRILFSPARCRSVGRDVGPRIPI